MKKNKFPEDQGLYPGEYIIDIANELLKEMDFGKYDTYEDVKSTLASKAIKLSMAIIKNDLKIMIYYQKAKGYKKYVTRYFKVIHYIFFGISTSRIFKPVFKII